MSFMLRRSTKNFNDVNHNFHVVDWLLRGHIDSSNVREIEALKISGVLQANQIVVGSGTAFEEGYDYRGKVTQLTDEGVYTGKIYANQIEVAGFKDEDGKTTIEGGYINTDVLEANSIEADKLRVNDLSAVSAYFTELYTGSATDFVYLYEEEDKPYINFYDANTLRMGLTSDRIQFFTSVGAYGGLIIGEEDPTYGLPAITMSSPFMARIMSRDPMEDTTRSAGLATRVHVGDLLLPPEMQSYAVDYYGESEVTELQITSGATSDGNMIVTFDGIEYDDVTVSNGNDAATVASIIDTYFDTVTYSREEVITLIVHWQAMEDGDLSITIDDVEYDDITVADTDNTPAAVAQVIHDYFAAVTGFDVDWNLSITDNVVMFTALVDGSKGSHSFDVKDTGVYLQMEVLKGYNVDFSEVWTKVLNGDTITFSALHNGSKGAHVLDDNGTGVIGAFTNTTTGYQVNSSCRINLDSHGDGISSPFGNIDLAGITRLQCVNPQEMARGYRIVKGPVPSGIGIINFICEG